MNSTLVFATHNVNKVLEVSKLMPSNLTLLSLNDINCFDEIAETGTTLAANAKLKADFVSQNYQLNCFADDTGLLIDALNGEPGVFSARYAGPEKEASANMALVLKKLKGQTQRTAHFKTIIHLNLDGEAYIFEGKVEGFILDSPRGKGGFGYDPIFQPNESTLSFAEMSLKEKNAISHRARAIEKLLGFLQTRF